MRLAERLQKAMRVPIAVGQMVVVRDADGKQVASGWVTDVDPKMDLVRVKDDTSGADLQIDVDATRYQLWVKPPPGASVRLGQQQTLYVRPSNPGIYSRNNFAIP